MANGVLKEPAKKEYAVDIENQVLTVSKGNTLSEIAQWLIQQDRQGRFAGTKLEGKFKGKKTYELVDEMSAANGIENKNFIRIGQRISFSEITGQKVEDVLAMKPVRRGTEARSRSEESKINGLKFKELVALVKEYDALRDEEQRLWKAQAIAAKIDEIREGVDEDANFKNAFVLFRAQNEGIYTTAMRARMDYLKSTVPIESLVGSGFEEAGYSAKYKQAVLNAIQELGEVLTTSDVLVRAQRGDKRAIAIVGGIIFKNEEFIHEIIRRSKPKGFDEEFKPFVSDGLAIVLNEAFRTPGVQEYISKLGSEIRKPEVAALGAFTYGILSDLAKATPAGSQAFGALSKAGVISEEKTTAWIEPAWPVISGLSGYASVKHAFKDPTTGNITWAVGDLLLTYSPYGLVSVPGKTIKLAKLVKGIKIAEEAGEGLKLVSIAKMPAKTGIWMWKNRKVIANIGYEAGLIATIYGPSVINIVDKYRNPSSAEEKAEAIGRLKGEVGYWEVGMRGILTGGMKAWKWLSERRLLAPVAASAVFVSLSNKEKITRDDVAQALQPLEQGGLSKLYVELKIGQAEKERIIDNLHLFFKNNAENTNLVINSLSTYSLDKSITPELAFVMAKQDLDRKGIHLQLDPNNSADVVTMVILNAMVGGK